MDIKETLTKAILDAARAAIEAGELPAGELPEVVLEVPPEKAFGDFATNFAMQSARVFHKSPRQIAEVISARIAGDWLDHTQIAGPGFLNFYLKSNVLYDSFAQILAAGEAFGQLPKKDAGRIQVEYVSANPTGPLHVGHGRGAAAGSALVNLLRAAGYDVESEYYINDAGNQMNILAASVNARYLELLGKEVTFPENGYHGADIIDTAKRIIQKDGDKYLALSEEERLEIFKDLAYKEKLALLKEDLEAFHVTFDNWFSERTLHPDAIRAAVEKLKANGNIYEKDGALWLKSTAYGDDKDRVVIRDNGVPTYLAADIAYHDNKYARGFERLINIWGADHHGYVCRVKAAMSALGHDAERLTVLLLQMVALYRDGELVKMSKRTGQSVTLRAHGGGRHRRGALFLPHALARQPARFRSRPREEEVERQSRLLYPVRARAHHEYLPPGGGGGAQATTRRSASRATPMTSRRSSTASTTSAASWARSRSSLRRASRS